MSSLLSSADWEEYLGILNDFGDTVFQHPIIWERAKKVPDRWGEDNSETSFENIDLLCMPNYNITRTWPISIETLTGEKDAQSVQVFFNKNYLKNNGYLTPEGNLDYNPALDRFVMNGRRYKNFGDTGGDSINLDQNEAIFILILQRDTLTTGEPNIK